MAHKHTEHFEKIYKEYADALFRFIHFRVSDREEAIELTEETFLKLFREMQKGKVEQHRALLYKIARNLIIDWYRKEKSIPLKPFLDEGDDADQISIDMFESGLPSAELVSEANRAKQAIANLPEIYREAVYLRFVEELTPKEIAKIIKESANTVSVRINRGAQELRKILHIEER